ncbi:hypothetical protein N7493_011859 [Penicillium malachiteum]|uniref:Uncharacterized protein n=1 Tax=Penicillium malachiteum TaxID=1324776 RepID=A0AAD6HAK8_9EURO|nr:hypothetical protein N7493_011859 [Penicillium malachiteum]
MEKLEWVPVERSRKTRWELILGIVCLSQTIALASYYFTATFTQPQTNPLPGQLDYWTDCGLTSAEAMARNCHFDKMLYAWIPTECFHPEALDEYHPFEDRVWYWDRNLTVPMNEIEMQQLALGNISIAYTPTFHHEHCLYAMRKLGMATDKKWLLIDGKSADIHHTTHCGMQIAHFVKGTVEKTYSTEHEVATARLQFPGCVKLPWRL